MISFVEGKIEYIFQNRVIINQKGIGYEITLPKNMINTIKVNDELRIYTFMSVKEDDISLFGFNNIDEREVFLKLITISGVGPKNALSILDNLGVASLINAILHNDHKTIKAVPGIGEKLSKVICIEMPSKLNKLDINIDKKILEDNDKFKNVKEEVMSALLALGYQKKTAEDLIKNVDKNNINDNVTSDEYLTLALKNATN